MVKDLEGDKTNAFCIALRKINAKVITIAGGSIYQEGGLPDRYIAHLLWSGWIEFKSYDRRVEPHQADQIRELRKRGINVWVIRFWPNNAIHIEDLEDSTTKGSITVKTFEAPWKPLDVLKALRELDNDCDLLAIYRPQYHPDRWVEKPCKTLEEAWAFWQGLKMYAPNRPRVEVRRGNEVLRIFT